LVRHLDAPAESAENHGAMETRMADGPPIKTVNHAHAGPIVRGVSLRFEPGNFFFEERANLGPS
jgi:hypothetical protein